MAASNQLVLMKKGRTRSEEDDCPICQLTLPVDGKQSMLKMCCMKEVCNGCVLAAVKRGMSDCPFCRTTRPDKSQVLAMVRKRVDAGDPVAIWFLGSKYRFGEYGLEKDFTRAVDLYERAVELGLKEAHFNLGVLYDNGTDADKDTTRLSDITRRQRCVAMLPPDTTLAAWNTMPETTTLRCSTG